MKKSKEIWLNIDQTSLLIVDLTEKVDINAVIIARWLAFCLGWHSIDGVIEPSVPAISLQLESNQNYSINFKKRKKSFKF